MIPKSDTVVGIKPIVNEGQNVPVISNRIRECLEQLELLKNGFRDDVVVYGDGYIGVLSYNLSKGAHEWSKVEWLKEQRPKKSRICRFVNAIRNMFRRSGPRKWTDKEALAAFPFGSSESRTRLESRK